MGGGGKVSSSLYSARVYNDAVQTIVTSPGSTTLIFPKARYNKGGLWAPGSPTQLTAAIDGIWAVGAMVAFDPSSAGTYRVLKLAIDAEAHVIASSITPRVGAPTATEYTVNTEIDLPKGASVTAYCQQDTGGDLNTIVDASLFTAFWMSYIGPIS